MKASRAADGPQLPPYVDLETAARLAGVTRRTVQNKLSSREIPRKAVKMDGRVKLVAVSALEPIFGPLKAQAEASPPQRELHGKFHEAFQETAEVIELRAKVTAKDEIIASLQATLDHERSDRENEREHWRKTVERMQGNLLAAQDTPTARALAGARNEPDVIIAPEPVSTDSPSKLRSKRSKKLPRQRWWAWIIDRKRNV